MIAMPCVAFSSRVRRPIRPRAGIEKYTCANSPRLVISIIRPRRAPTISITGPKLVVRHFDHQGFERFFGHAVRLARDDLRLADRQLITLAAHRFDQHAQVQQPAAGDGNVSRPFDRLDLQGDVALQLAHQPVAQMAAGDVFAARGRTGATC